MIQCQNCGNSNQERKNRTYVVVLLALLERVYGRPLLLELSLKVVLTTLLELDLLLGAGNVLHGKVVFVRSLVDGGGSLVLFVNGLVDAVDGFLDGLLCLGVSLVGVLEVLDEVLLVESDIRSCVML
jgi:hypothetical protein